MTATLSGQCPHCLTENVAFTLVSESLAPSHKTDAGYFWNVFFNCNKCFSPLSVRLATREMERPSQFEGCLSEHPKVSNLIFYPKPEPPDIPAHLPEPVARAFMQAETAIRRGAKDNSEAVVAMDRRALELSTKDKAPEKSSASLFARIDYLAQVGQLTPALQKWAHSLRVTGNEALHDMTGIAEDEARDTHELTRFILIYLYSLPEQVRQARALKS